LEGKTGLQLRVQFAIAGTKEESRPALTDVLLQESSDGWMKVYLPECARRFKPLFNLAVTYLLLDGERREIGSDVLVDLKTKRLTNAWASWTAQNEDDSLSRCFQSAKPVTTANKKDGVFCFVF
jgi:hypothetical protein